MTGPCPFPCTNKTEFGYCKTTACIYAPTIRVTLMPDKEEQALKKLAAYEDAEEQGRLVILPCKVGDKVFRVVPKCSRSYIQCPYNGGFGIDRCHNCDAFIKEESFYLSMFEDIGKTVYLTHEEAEAALKEEKRSI